MHRKCVDEHTDLAWVQHVRLDGGGFTLRENAASEPRASASAPKSQASGQCLHPNWHGLASCQFGYHAATAGRSVR